jgi:hypothetical protein
MATAHGDRRRLASTVRQQIEEAMS